MSVATSAPSSNSKDDEIDDTYVGNTTTYYYQGQHGVTKSISVTPIRRRKLDPYMLAQAVIALGEQFAKEAREKGKKILDNQSVKTRLK